MSDVTITPLVPGDPENVNNLNSSLAAIVAALNDLDYANLSSTLKQQLGISAPGVISRGYTGIATEETRSNVAYGKLATPDQVSSVVLPANGLLLVAYQARWKKTVDDTLYPGRAAIFLGANQLKTAVATDPTAPSVQEATLGTTATLDKYKPLATGPSGLVSYNVTGNSYTGDVTTGQVLGSRAADSIGAVGVPLGGFTAIFAAANTYDVSVQFATGGTCAVRDRKLWVWAIGF